MLKYISKLCGENNIKYYLCGGTLLGAVRHKGFIPWDDDIDIIMPRPDYEKFVRLFNEKNENKDLALWAESRDEYLYPKVQVFNAKTVINGARGIRISIFRLDNVSDDMELYKKMFRLIRFYNKIYVAKTLGKKKGRAFHKEAVLFAARNIFRLFSVKKLLKLIDETVTKYSSAESNYAACVMGIYAVERERMRRGIFDETIEIEFEGELFTAPKEYDEYLTTLYGDYMTPTPPEQRIPKHNFEAYWKE
ncbi:MAG: LicD family protein [Oscillospiraceae bacterium]|nr:LicD family protein [Oscillospiraceae bacterium]